VVDTAQTLTMKAFMKKLTIITTCFIVMSNAWGGLFGPSNFDECMLDKMKGQLPSMRSSAINACEIAFPSEKSLDTNMWSSYSENISYDYKKTTNQLIDVVIKNESNYKITRIRVVTKDSCKKDSMSLDVVDVTAPLMGNTFTAKVNDARKVQCVEVEFFGKRYK
jgi:hypothetical protein